MLKRKISSFPSSDFILTRLANSEELREKERAERNMDLEVQSLESRQEELATAVSEGEKALESDKAKIAQSGDNTEAGAVRLEGQFVSTTDSTFTITQPSFPQT